MPRLDGLSDRELEVLQLVSGHLTNLQIADRLTISELTVESHVHHILHKLHVNSRRSAARIYLEWIAHSRGNGNS